MPAATTQPCCVAAAAQVLTRLLDHVDTIITGRVANAEYTNDGAWHLSGDGFAVTSSYAIFASGGFGAVASADEAAQLHIHSTAEVHASTNDGLLWSMAKREGWARDPLNGWYLEHVGGVPKWFLWDARATVLESQPSGGYALVYDEAASYDARGRARKRAHGEGQQVGTSSSYVYVDPAAT